MSTVVIRNRSGNEVETTEEIARSMVGRGEGVIVEVVEAPKKKGRKSEVETTEETLVTE